MHKGLARPGGCVLSIFAVALTMPLAGGCSPDCMVAALILVPTVAAHLDHSTPARQPRLEQPAVAQRAVYTPASTVQSGSGASGPWTAQDSSMQARPSVHAKQPATSWRQSQDSRAGAETVVSRSGLSGTNSRPNASKSQSSWACPVTDGAQAYLQMRWEVAAELLQKAVDYDRCSDSDKSKAYATLGAIAYQTGDSRTARRYFAEAYKYDRQTRLSSELFPPHLVDFYKEVNRIRGR